jgi:hypothetical protein
VPVVVVLVDLLTQKFLVVEEEAFVILLILQLFQEKLLVFLWDLEEQAEHLTELQDNREVLPKFLEV